jgi:thioredoxin reductase
MNDVIIIGGSFAGLAAALQLGRARRKVTVLDTDRPRNRFAGYSHGVLGHDHKPPLDILVEARQQLARYPTIRAGQCAGRKRIRHHRRFLRRH